MRIIATALLLAVLGAPAQAAHRHHPHTFCVPVFIEGAGIVRICAPSRGR